MTYRTADSQLFDADDEAPTPMTVEQLATEPPVAALDVLRLTGPAHDALAARIQAAAAAELGRRQMLHAAAHAPGIGPQLVVATRDRESAARGLFVRGSVARGGTRARGWTGRDLTPLLARALRPALFAAAAAALFAVGLARQSNAAADATGQQVSDASAVQALSLHDPSAQWADQARAPTVDALGRAIGLGGAP